MKTLEKTGCRLLRTTSVLPTCKRPWVSRALEEGDKILPGGAARRPCASAVAYGVPCPTHLPLGGPGGLAFRLCCGKTHLLLRGFWLSLGGSFPRTLGTSLPEIKVQFSSRHRPQLLVSCPHSLLHPHTTDGEAGSEKGRGVQGHPKSGTELDWNLAGQTLEQRYFSSTQVGRQGDSRVGGGGGRQGLQR